MSLANHRLTASIAVITAVCSSVAWGIEKPKAQEVSGKVKWVYDYEAGKRLSRTSGKPMLVVFRCER